MKTKYFFMGTETELGELKYETFGTEVEFTEAEALNAIGGGAQFCPEADWTFTEQEVSIYPFPAFRAEAPEAFQTKFHAAGVAIHNHLLKLQEGK